jgi:hypothetical protein
MELLAGMVKLDRLSYSHTRFSGIARKHGPMPIPHPLRHTKRQPGSHAVGILRSSIKLHQDPAMGLSPAWCGWDTQIEAVDQWLGL